MFRHDAQRSRDAGTGGGADSVSSRKYVSLVSSAPVDSLSPAAVVSLDVDTSAVVSSTAVVPSSATVSSTVVSSLSSSSLGAAPSSTSPPVSPLVVESSSPAPGTTGAAGRDGGRGSGSRHLMHWATGLDDSHSLMQFKCTAAAQHSVATFGCGSRQIMHASDCAVSRAARTAPSAADARAARARSAK